MNNTMVIREDEIRLKGFDMVTDEITLVVYESGLGILLGLHRQTIKNYPIHITRTGETIVIQDKQLVDILHFRNTPTVVEFLQIDNGYVALTNI